MPDISQTDGQKIAKVAKSWKGTPYVTIGAASVKGTRGDCSGSTWSIYNEAGFSYEFRSTSTFPDYAISSGLFRKLAEGETKQDGDILHWSGHMAIYAALSLAQDTDGNATTARTTAKGQKWTMVNDIWTATHPGGPAYCAYELKWWNPVKPTVYRYQKK